MQHYFEKSNDMSSFSGSDRERSYPVSPKISENENNGQLSDFILQFDKNDEKQFNDMIIREEYLKIQNPLGQTRNYAKSVAKRRTPISFKVRNSSCQKTRDEQDNNSQVQRNCINLLNDKDGHTNQGNESHIPYHIQRNANKEEILKKQFKIEKKIIILPKYFEEEQSNLLNDNIRNPLKDRINSNSPERGNANSPILTIQKDLLSSQQQRNTEFANKSKTEMLRQNRVKKKVIESSFLTGKREANLTSNSITVTTTSRLKNSITPIFESNENNLISQKMISSVNPRTLPFLSTERGTIHSHLFPIGEIKTCTAKGTDSFLNHFLPTQQKNYQSNHQPSNSATSTINYNSAGSNTLGNNNNLNNKISNQMHHNTISTNQTIKSRSSRYSSNTPSKRIGGFISKALDENEFVKESVKITSRNSQLRRQQYNANQNNILINSLQNTNINSNTQDNITSISLTPNTITSTIENNQPQSTNQNPLKSAKNKPNLQNSPIQQAFNKTQFNKIVVNFSTLKKEGKELGKGLFGSILNNIPKHPLFQQISQRQSNNNNHNGIHQISSLLEKPNDSKLIQPQIVPYSPNNIKNIESIEVLMKNISNKLINLENNLSSIQSSNKFLLEAIEQDEDKNIVKYIEDHQMPNSITLSNQIDQHNTLNVKKIEISQILPLLQQCFEFPFEMNDPSSFTFLQTDNDDSEQEEIVSV